MNLLNTLSNDARQTQTIPVPDGSQIFFRIEYRENQAGWFYSLNWKTVSINNRRLVCSPNILRQFRRVLPFGFFVTSKDGLEPIYAEDFSSQRVLVYFLYNKAVQSDGTVQDELQAAENFILSLRPVA